MFRTILSPSLEGIWTQLFGIANGQALNQFSIQMPLAVGHKKNKCISIHRKTARHGLNRAGYICSASPRPSSSSADTGGSSSERNPSTSESFEDFSGLMSTGGGEKDNYGNRAPVLSTFDFLELKRELDKEENSKEGSEEEELKPEKSENAPLSSEKEGIVVGSSRVRGGRQVMRMSNLLAKQVISMESARCLGFVSQLWVDTKLWAVALVEVRSNFLSGDTEKFLLDDVYQVGDVILVLDEPLVENELKMTGLDTLVGYDVIKPGRRSIGKIRGYTFNINTGAVEALEFDSFGFSIIPSSLVSTYRLSVEDVLDVESDKVFVYEEALSHVQRLTKGFWDSGNVGKSKQDLQSLDFRRKRAYYDQRRSRRRSSSYARPQFSDEACDEEVHWDFPIDY